MEDVFGPDCKDRIDIAIEDLEAASRLLRACVLADSVDLMSNAYSLVRAAKVTLQGAIEDYQDHLVHAA